MQEAIAREYIALIPNVFGSFSKLNSDSPSLSHMQNHVVSFIYMKKQALNLKEISAGLNLVKQQLTPIIRDLEESGYLVKKADSRDKRAVLVSLTSKGRAIEEKKWIDIYQQFSFHLAKLKDEEQLDLHYALHKLNVLLTKMEE
ncbi:MAG: winged helix DNA-binding protein [Sporolactobacillus sp.]